MYFKENRGGKRGANVHSVKKKSEQTHKKLEGLSFFWRVPTGTLFFYNYAFDVIERKQLCRAGGVAIWARNLAYVSDTRE